MGNEELELGARVDFTANAEHHVGEVLAPPAATDGLGRYRVNDSRTGEEFLLERKDIRT